MANIKNELLDMLLKDAEAQKSKAILSMKLLSEHAAGIGDHSTGDFYKNANEALQMLVDADDKIEALKKYYYLIND